MTDAAVLVTEPPMDAQSDTAPANTICWFEIPASDYERAIGFYEAVLQTTLTRYTENVPNPFALFPTADGRGISGHIYPGAPAKDGGPTVHLIVPDTLEATLERVFDAGGQVLPGIIPLPQGRFAYAVDTERNSVGFFEANQG